MERPQVQGTQRLQRMSSEFEQQQTMLQNTSPSTTCICVIQYALVSQGLAKYNNYQSHEQIQSAKGFSYKMHSWICGQVGKTVRLRS